MFSTNRLNQFLEMLSKSQDELALLLDLTQATISRYMSGKLFPSVELLEKLYEFGLSIDWLFSGTGSIFALNEEGRNHRLIQYPPNLK